ncbi:MAG: hypothetical protein PHX79_05170 [Sphaerochaetaceae bacterium]|nr:hypothetical protein [Sphaerochaetaceae bacterium]
METRDLQKMLTDAAQTITKQSEHIARLKKTNKDYESQNNSLQQKIAGYQRKEDCEKLASVLIEKGVVNPTDYRAKVQELYSGKEDLALLTKAAELFIPKSPGLEFVGHSDSEMSKTADQIAEERFSNMKY